MSLLNLILLSTTPIVGLGVLLGLCKFESYVLDERADLSSDLSDLAAAEVVSSGLDLGAAAMATTDRVPATVAAPAHRAAA